MCINYVIRQPDDKIKCVLVFARKYDTQKREQNKKKIPPILYYIVTLSKRNQLETEYRIWRQTLDLTGR